MVFRTASAVTPKDFGKDRLIKTKQREKHLHLTVATYNDITFMSEERLAEMGIELDKII